MQLVMAQKAQLQIASPLRQPPLLQLICSSLLVGEQRQNDMAAVVEQAATLIKQTLLSQQAFLTVSQWVAVAVVLVVAAVMETTLHFQQ
jgi:hypothetical protein